MKIRNYYLLSVKDFNTESQIMVTFTHVKIKSSQNTQKVIIIKVTIIASVSVTTLLCDILQLKCVLLWMSLSLNFKVTKDFIFKASIPNKSTLASVDWNKNYLPVLLCSGLLQLGDFLPLCTYSRLSTLSTGWKSRTPKDLWVCGLW